MHTHCSEEEDAGANTAYKLTGLEPCTDYVLQFYGADNGKRYVKYYAYNAGMRIRFWLKTGSGAQYLEQTEVLRSIWNEYFK